MCDGSKNSTWKSYFYSHTRIVKGRVPSEMSFFSLVTRSVCPFSPLVSVEQTEGPHVLGINDCDFYVNRMCARARRRLVIVTAYKMYEKQKNN